MRTMAVDQQMIDAACSALGVSELNTLRDGGQKTVRLVEHNGEHAVLKVVSVGSSSPDALRRAQREVELLHALTAENLVRVRSELVELGNPLSGAAWLEEYLDGSDLSDELGIEQWSWVDARTMGLEVARGLDALHRVGVVHRDLSAANVRRLTNGTYRVMDPGFARHTLRSGITVGGQPGTPGYLSPEHLSAYSGAPTPSSDVFQVGILMYEALTGALPIPYRGDVTDYLLRLQALDVQDLRAVRPDLGQPALQLVQRCLHGQPARRFLNGGALAGALEALS